MHSLGEKARHSSKRTVINNRNAEMDSADIEAMALRLAEVALPLTVQEEMGFISQAQAQGAMEQMKQQQDNKKAVEDRDDDRVGEGLESKGLQQHVCAVIQRGPVKKVYNSGVSGGSSDSDDDDLLFRKI